ncbi:MAG TPA: hypothetical protein VGZ52_02655 [Acidimicrobiales bacterium]|jgi:hypothetical protein|nr:hypothetical protein [Acidimicrobiales bacterium]
MAPTIDAIEIADPPDSWIGAGFTVDDDGVCVVGAVRLRLVGRDGDRKRILSWSLRDVPPDTTSIDGLTTTTSKVAAPMPVTHANGVELIDHLVIMSPDADRTIGALNAAGLATLRTRIVDPEQYGFDARQTFFRLGEVILELIGPDQPQGDGPAAFFGLAYTVADIDALPAFYGEHLGRVKEAVQPGRRITTLHHKELGLSVATAFMSPEPSSV